MIRVALIARSTLFTCKGGDTVQVMQTAGCLREVGITVDVKLTHQKIDYSQYDLLHFFNIIRPADIVCHIKRSKKPYVVSTVFVEYSAYDKVNRKGISGILFRRLSPDRIEYVKTIARQLAGREALQTISYVWKGQRASIKYVLKNAALLLPNSRSEYERLQQRYNTSCASIVVTNGIDQQLFHSPENTDKDALLVLCVARIEGIKNQLNLIKAIRGTKYKLLLIGSPSPNQPSYYRRCRDAAGSNVSFIGHVKQHELISYYQKAKVHVLPSWFETTGLSSLEAAAMGCNVVITANGDAKEYFGTDAFYCDPSSPESIYDAIDRAAASDCQVSLQKKIVEQHTWQQAAETTKIAYQKVIQQR